MLVLPLAALMGVSACERELSTRNYELLYPDSSGRFLVLESYYTASSVFEAVKHGPSTYTDKATGTTVGHCIWRDNAPFEGICWIPTAGDAGSWGGLGAFEEYRKGQLIRRFSGRPTGNDQEASQPM